jgi:hypothetical protein
MEYDNFDDEIKWNEFEKSGKISDYLEYKGLAAGNCVTADAACSLNVCMLKGR